MSSPTARSLHGVAVGAGRSAGAGGAAAAAGAASAPDAPGAAGADVAHSAAGATRDGLHAPPPPAPAASDAGRPRIAALAAFYAASVTAGGFGNGLALLPGIDITWWPPVGVLLAMLLLDERRLWPWWIGAAALAELTCNALWFRNPAPWALVYTAGNMIQAAVAALLIKRFAGPGFALTTPREFGAFVLFGAALAPAISATVIATTDTLLGKHAFATAWPLVWLGDATGVLVAAPLTFVAVRAWRGRAQLPRARRLELAALGLALISAAALFLVGLLPTVYLMLPLLLWASARFQLQGAAVGLGFVSVMIALATSQGVGLFAGEPGPGTGPILLQTFLGICALSSLLVAAVSLEHVRVLEQLKHLNADLEARVAERTATLRDSQASLRRFLDTASTGLVRKSRDLRYVSVNTAYGRLMGLPPAQIVGHTLAEVLGEAALERVRPYIARVLGGERVEFEIDLPTRHRGERWFHIVYEPDRNDSGQIVGWVVSSVDITERKVAEEELRAATQRVQLAAEATGVGIWEWDPTTGRIRWSAQMFRIYGIEPTADSHVSYELWRSCVLEEDRAAQEATLAETVRLADRSTREFRIRRPGDGQVRTLRSVETARTDAHGQVRFVTGTSLDVTEARRLEASLKDADRRKDIFLATLSHELRNPLAPMKNALELIRRARGNTAVIEQSRTVLERQMAQMERLIDDLLDVGRITHGKLELRTAPVELALLLQQALESTQPHAARLGHRVEVTLPAEPIRLEADAVRLTQVFGNLLTNACKYTPAPGCIRLAAEREGHEAVVTVSDNGIGIAPQMLDKVFDMFTQGSAPPGTTGGGLGIGLSLVRFIVERHGGTVTATSPGPGQGSVFTVRLPACAEPDRDGAAAAPGGRAAGAAAPDEGTAALTGAGPAVPPSRLARPGAAPPPARRVLVVDDNEDSARTLAELLRMGGHETRMAHDGDAAIEMAQQFRPEVVLLDIGLPGQDGHAVCRAIRARPWSRHTVIVAVTGWGQEEDRRRSSEAGFDGHLVKPIDLAAIERLLATVPAQAG